MRKEKNGPSVFDGLNYIKSENFETSDIEDYIPRLEIRNDNNEMYLGEGKCFMETETINNSEIEAYIKEEYIKVAKFQSCFLCQSQ